MRIGVGVLARELAKTPFAVVDLETTGLSPQYDRIVEIAIVVLRPGQEPELVLDTLVNPERSMAGTEFHGITAADVQGAPAFGTIAPVVASALANRVIASHNAAFDMGLLGGELSRAGYPSILPHVCTMMLPRLGDSEYPRLSLKHACVRHSIEPGTAHSAASDALAAAALLKRYIGWLRRIGVRTFGDLRGRQHNYEFLGSLDERPLPAPPTIHGTAGLKPRRTGSAKAPARGVATYLEAVLEVVADLHVTDEELAYVSALREDLVIEPATVRAVHAKVFWAMLGRYVEDTSIDVGEAHHLSRLHAVLERLGWAPGQGIIEG